MAQYEWEIVLKPHTLIRIQLPHAELDYDAKYDGRYDSILAEMRLWCQDAARPGCFRHQFGSGDDHRSLYVFFSDPDVAMECKLRWTGAFTTSIPAT